MIQILEAQLAASCRNVVAFFASECRRHAMALQHVQKGFLHRHARTLPIETFDLIVWNEINFGPQASSMVDKSVCLLLKIIEASNEDILQSERLTLTRAVILASIH